LNTVEAQDPENVYTILSDDEFFDAFGIHLAVGEWEASVEWFRREMIPTDDRDIDPVEVLKALRDRRTIAQAVDAIALTDPKRTP
jgi:hypothetical protein